MAIQSNFHKDLSKFEPTYKWGLTKAQIFMILKMIPGFIIIVSEVFLLTGILFWIVAILTAAITITPPVLVGIGKWQTFKNDMDFHLKHQERYYQTERIRRYTPDEFIKQKEIKETKRSRSKKA